MLYAFFKQTRYCPRTLQPSLVNVMTKKETHYEVFIHLFKIVGHIQALIYIIANLLGEALKCVCKQTPGNFQVKAFWLLSENISPGVKFLSRSGHLSVESCCTGCHCGSLRCWGGGGLNLELWWCKNEILAASHMEFSNETKFLLGIPHILEWD